MKILVDSGTGRNGKEQSLPYFEHLSMNLIIRDEEIAIMYFK